MSDTDRSNGSKPRDIIIIVISSLLTICVSCIVALQAIVYKTNSIPLDPQLLKPINLNQVKESIKAYHSGGGYDEELHLICLQWTTYFQSRQRGPNDAVVFDIDDTVLANYPEMIDKDFGYIPKYFNAWILQANASAIPPTREFYLSLLHLNYKILFLTGRNETQKNATVKNLAYAGFPVYERLVLRPSTDNRKAAIYKSEARATLSKDFNIVGCIGDQLSDLAGDYAGYLMKVPNYCYIIE